MVGQELAGDKKKNTLSLCLFEMGKCPTVTSSQNWQQPVGVEFNRVLSGDG